MKKPIVPGYVVALLLLLVLGGCEKKSGEAVLVGKDYVAAVKQGEEVKDERATNHEQWIVEVRMGAMEKIARKRSGESHVSRR
jgi:hypothetical protein